MSFLYNNNLNRFRRREAYDLQSGGKGGSTKTESGKRERSVFKELFI